jgi:hypothetical protein
MTDYNSRLNGTTLQSKLNKLADQHPAYFDAALAVLRSYHNNEETLLGAIMVGLMQTHALGIAGTPVPEDPELKRIRAGGKPKPIVAKRVSRSRAS